MADFLETLSFKVELLQDFLENFVNYHAEHQSIVNVTIATRVKMA